MNDEVRAFLGTLNAAGGCYACHEPFTEIGPVEHLNILDAWGFNPVTGKPSGTVYRTIRESRTYHSTCVPDDLIVEENHATGLLTTWAERRAEFKAFEAECLAKYGPDEDA